MEDKYAKELIKELKLIRKSLERSEKSALDERIKQVINNNEERITN